MLLRYGSIAFWLMSMAVWLRPGTVGGQVVRVGDEAASDVPHGWIEAGVHLELYGHPATARRDIHVDVDHHEMKLSGKVRDEFERETARRIAIAVAPDLKLEDHLKVKPDAKFAPPPDADDLSSADLRRRLVDRLAEKFPVEIRRDLTLSVYRVERDGDPARDRVVVLEGVVPSVRDQLAMSELLLFEPPEAAAVVNRTRLVDGYVREYKPRVSVRVPFVDVDVNVYRGHGVDVGVGPLAVRTGEKYRAEDDRLLVDHYWTAVRADADLQNAPVHPHVVGGVLVIEGRLRAADRLRAVALAADVKGLRGVVDRTELVEGGPPSYRESDLEAYLRYRLGEHAGAWNIELRSGKERPSLRASILTPFHSRLAQRVIESDGVLSKIAMDVEFREEIPRR